MTQLKDRATSAPDPRTAAASRRERDRAAMAKELGVVASTLDDGADLAHDVGLDSLAMMTLVTWLETRGVTIGSDRLMLATVADVLDLLERVPARTGTTLALTDAGGPARGAGPDPAELPLPHLHEEASPAEVPGADLVPRLANRIFRLDPVEPGDVPFLFALAVRPETGFRWRYRGAPPSAERFAAELWKQVLVHFVARRIVDGEPVGYVVAYAPEQSLAHCYVGAVFGPGDAGSGLPAQATRLFVRYLFHTFPLRKLYLDVPGFNWPQVSSAAGSLFEVEGVLRGHDFYAGRHWDKYVCAIYRPTAAGAPIPAPHTTPRKEPS